KTERVQLLFALLLTLSIIASMNIVGVTMIAATLIMPAMTARMMTNRFSYMQIYSVLIGAITGVAGMYLSYLFNAASGATIVLFGALLFCIAALTKHVREKRILRANLHRHGGLVHSHPYDPDHQYEESKTGAEGKSEEKQKETK
nr:metal ABC transporter permease [Betaproteobacteria bacterium]